MQNFLVVNRLTCKCNKWPWLSIVHKIRNAQTKKGRGEGPELVLQSMLIFLSSFKVRLWRGKGLNLGVTYFVNKTPMTSLGSLISWKKNNFIENDPYRFRLLNFLLYCLSSALYIYTCTTPSSLTQTHW